MSRPGARGRGRAAGLRLGARGLGWQESALCRNAEDVFFTDDTGRAKACCGLCAVWRECLDYGLDSHGVWGGLTRPERARLVRLRTRMATKPQDPLNARDVDRLVRLAGLGVERLAAVLGTETTDIEALLNTADPAGTGGAGTPEEPSVWGAGS